MVPFKATPRLSISVWITALIVLVIGAVYSPLKAQTDLERISTVERSDGLGYVIRHHLSAPVDSFKVIQAEPDLIQVILHADRLGAASVDLPDSNPAIDEYRLYPLPTGYGIDIRIKEGHYYTSQAYNDINGRDLLVALTEANASQLQRLTASVERITWSLLSDNLLVQLQTEQEALQARTEASSSLDERSANIEAEPVTRSDNNLALNDANYVRVKDNLRFDTVVLDAGHGGHDPGKPATAGMHEKDIALAITKKVGGYIEASSDLNDVNVVYTRSDDTFVGLEERGQIANRAGGDLFVSIHVNSVAAGPGYQSASGFELYILGQHRTQAALEIMKRENSVIRLEEGRANDRVELTDSELLNYEMQNYGNIVLSERLAGMMEYQLDERAARRSRGVKQAGFIVLYHASMPAVYVETGFMTNPDEAKFLSSEYGQDLIASAIFRAIRDYALDYETERTITTSSR